MKTKYDWSGVPPQYKWLATDEDGEINAFTEQPILEQGLDYWWNVKPSTFIQMPYCFIKSHNHKGNWQDSLEERPSEVN